MEPVFCWLNLLELLLEFRFYFLKNYKGASSSVTKQIIARWFLSAMRTQKPWLSLFAFAMSISIGYSSTDKLGSLFTFLAMILTIGFFLVLDRPASIEWFIEDQAFSPSYNLASPPALSPLPSAVVSLSQSQSPVEITDGGGEGVGEEPNHRMAIKPGPP